MRGRRMMGGGVMARRVVATADVAARLAHPQMNPARAYGQAFLATGNRLGELEAFDRVEVAAGGHEVIVTASDPSHAPIRNARVREERAAWCTSNRVSSARCRTGSSREHPGSELRPLRAGLVRWAAADTQRRDGARTHVDPSDRGRQLGPKPGRAEQRTTQTALQSRIRRLHSRLPGCGPGCRGFESRRSPSRKAPLTRGFLVPGGGRAASAFPVLPPKCSRAVPASSFSNRTRVRIGSRHDRLRRILGCSASTS